MKFASFQYDSIGIRVAKRRNTCIVGQPVGRDAARGGLCAVRMGQDQQCAGYDQVFQGQDAGRITEVFDTFA